MAKAKKEKVVEKTTDKKVETPMGEETKVKKQPKKMKRLNVDDDSIKIDLSQLKQEEEKPVEEKQEKVKPKEDEQPKDKKDDKVVEEVQEKVEEEKEVKKEEETEQPVLEEITDEKTDEEVVD